jgi:hypothetical protein
MSSLEAENEITKAKKLKSMLRESPLTSQFLSALTNFAIEEGTKQAVTDDGTELVYRFTELEKDVIREYVNRPSLKWEDDSCGSYRVNSSEYKVTASSWDRNSIISVQFADVRNDCTRHR